MAFVVNSTSAAITMELSIMNILHCSAISKLYLFDKQQSEYPMSQRLQLMCHAWHNDMIVKIAYVPNMSITTHCVHEV